MITVKNALTIASQKLDDVTDIPRKEAMILLSFVLNKNQAWLFLNDHFEFDESEYFELLDRRVQYEPIEYITNSVSFYSNELYIRDGVLIPRPETEIIVEESLKIAKTFYNPTILDIGTGSGAIAGTLKRLYPLSNITAIDINPIAIEIAKINAPEVEILEMDFRDFSSQVDIIVTNPPYIANSYKLPKSVEYEPSNALFGGEKGDELIKEIIDKAIELKTKFLICEIGYDQAYSLTKYLKSKNIDNFNIIRDYSNLDRCLIAQIGEYKCDI